MQLGATPMPAGIPTGQAGSADANGQPWKRSETSSRQYDGARALSVFFPTQWQEVMLAELLDGEDRHKPLAAWMRGSRHGPSAPGAWLGAKQSATINQIACAA